MYEYLFPDRVVARPAETYRVSLEFYLVFDIDSSSI